MNDGFAKLEKAIDLSDDVVIDVDDFRDAIELAAPRIGSAMAAEAVRLAGRSSPSEPVVPLPPQGRSV